MSNSHRTALSCIVSFLHETEIDSETDRDTERDRQVVKPRAYEGRIAVHSSSSPNEVTLSLTYDLQHLQTTQLSLSLAVSNVFNSINTNVSANSNSNSNSNKKPQKNEQQGFYGSLFTEESLLQVRGYDGFYDGCNVQFTAQNFAALCQQFPARFWVSKSVSVRNSTAFDGDHGIDDLAQHSIRGSHFVEIPSRSFYNTPVELSPKYDCLADKVFQVFSKQDLAFAKFDSLSEDIRINSKVFTYESVQCGKRLFLVADVNRFIQEYFKIKSHERHVYEIIRSSFPCRLYFDLEFNRTSNPDVDGDLLTKEWTCLVLWKIKQFYDLDLSYDNVAVLDSTTHEKYSKHLILQLTSGEQKEWLFVDNLECGKIVRSILLDITEAAEHQLEFLCLIEGRQRRPKAEFAHFWINSPVSVGSDPLTSKPKVLFIDVGVYTRNRAFRIYGSCKFGKTQAFRLLPNDKKRYFHDFSSGSIQETMLSVLQNSFIVPMDLLSTSKREKDETYDDECLKKKRRIEQTDASDFYLHSSLFNFKKYLLLPLIEIPSMPISQFKFTGSVELRSVDSSSYHSSSTGKAWKNNFVIAESHQSQQSTWFPLLDSHVLQFIANRGGVEGYFTNWMLYVQANGDFPVYKLRYQIGRNRFCENVGRMHKSNGIYIDVNLMTKQLTQACWDTDCKGFKSKPVDIDDGIIPDPTEIINMVEKHVDSKQLKS